MPQPDDALAAFLTEKGYSPSDIDKIKQKVADYDDDTVRRSIFDSIERGSFSIDAIIKEALGEEAGPSE